MIPCLTLGEEVDERRNIMPTPEMELADRPPGAYACTFIDLN
jgi:hypothetical protein